MPSTPPDLDTVDWTADEWAAYYTRTFGYARSRARFMAALTLGHTSGDLHVLPEAPSAENPEEADGS